MSFKIVVMSCDKNQDLFDPFHYCMEKYWSKHPEIIYSTESVENPYYKTICKNYPIDKWTKRVYDTIKELKCDNVLLVVDDLFIRDYVNNFFIERIADNVGGIIGAYNFEKSFDSEDLVLGDLLAFRNPSGRYKTSLMCQLWNRKAMLDIFNCEKDPWTFEKDNDDKGYIFLINHKGNLINWGYNNRKWFGIRKGKWCKECKDFFDKENFYIDYSIRGFYE